MIAKITICFVCILFFYSCSENPKSIDNSNTDTTASGYALILCEGLWGYNNSTISKLNLNTLTIINDYTALANSNFKIGDTGNDIAIKGDTFFVVVTTSKALEYFDVKTGKLLGYITFEGNSAPRHVAIINDSTYAVTDLYKDCVYIINLNQKKIEKVITVGPAPEFVEYHNGKLFVANSGYGDYRAKEPKAGTLSVVDVKLGIEIHNIPLFPNPIEIAVDKQRNRLYVSYNHLPSLKDSIGGIVMFDLNNLNILKHWKFQSRCINLIESTGELIFVSNEKVLKLNPENGDTTVLARNPNSNEFWYSVAFDTKRNFLIIGNAKNYVVEGELLVFEIVNSKFTFKKKFTVGLNPSEILIKN